MSTEENEPEDIVTDGVQDETGPLPKESPARQASGAGRGEAADHRGDDRGPKAPGPAEEENSESGDDRGLTADASPSD
jgi:hypothetical protein